MARKPRIHVPGGVYHVMLRGNGGRDIFFCNEDRYQRYLLVQEGVIRFGYRVHGFCWMTNHLHMAVEVGIKRQKVRVMKILTILDKNDKLIGLSIYAPWEQGEYHANLWWSIDTNLKVLSVETEGAWQSDDIKTGFQEQVGATYKAKVEGGCASAAGLVAFEVLVVSKVHLAVK